MRRHSVEIAGRTTRLKDLLAGTTRALLVQPRFSIRSFWNYAETCRLTGAKYSSPPLGLMTVASLLGSSLFCVGKVVDGRVFGG